ncbi:MAG: agmatinase [Flavobacteriales bacterium]|nr:agmatinase [Flavobacteriales bacterium]
MMNYAGIEDKYAERETAEVALLPIPYDGTSTWGKGADKGPAAFLEASENMERYDIETRLEAYKKGVFLADSLTGMTSPEDMVKKVEQSTGELIDEGKFTTVIGGEHSISIGTIRAFNKRFEDLTVLQLDAHADLRPEYQGTPFNHACAVHEASRTTNLVQVGIRSMDSCEVEYMDEDHTFWAHKIYKDDRWMKDALRLMTQNVFITIDLDVFDPAIMPSTGTPEPGGMGWNQVLRFLRQVFKTRHVVGFDLVELAPNPNNKAPDFLAAKLYYKMLSYLFKWQK